MTRDSLGGVSGSGGNSPQPGPTHHTTPTILVIDDEPSIGATLRILLGDRYDVRLVDSGPEAKVLLEAQNTYDVILCDLNLPLFNGMELQQWLQAQNSPMATKVIFMTGGSYSEEAHSFLETVNERHLTKPFDPDTLIQMVEKIRA